MQGVETMSVPFGPWSTSFDAGSPERLSNFWKRRMGRLDTVMRSGGAMTRREWLRLGAVGGALAAVPTLRTIAAPSPRRIAAEDRKGRIYLYGQLQAGDQKIQGLLAVDPDPVAWNKVADLHDGSWRVSPDGKFLAFCKYENIDNTSVRGVNIQLLDLEKGGEPNQIWDSGGMAVWSGDSKQLIVNKVLPREPDGPFSYELWRINADGSGAEKLPIPNTEEVDDWSADGRWVITVSTRHNADGLGYQLYAMHPDGTGERRLTEGKGLNVYPRISPDGRRVVYTHSERKDKEVVSSLRIVDIDGKNSHQILEESDDLAPDHACWSPDGKTIAVRAFTWQIGPDGTKFAGGDSVLNKYRIILIDPDGGNLRTLELPTTDYLGSQDWR
jgi:hypothetical protein